MYRALSTLTLSSTKRVLTTYVDLSRSSKYQFLKRSMQPNAVLVLHETQTKK